MLAKLAVHGVVVIIQYRKSHAAIVVSLCEDLAYHRGLVCAHLGCLSGLNCTLGNASLLSAALGNLLLAFNFFQPYDT